MEPNPSDLLTAKEVASILRVSRMTVSRWAEDGHLPSRKLPSGRRRFVRSEIEAALRRDPEQAAS